MEIHQAQQKIKELLGEIEHPRLASFVALTEEVGEVANEIMRKEIYEETEDMEELKAEIADVLICVLELANVYNFDLDSEFEKKLEQIKPRAEGWKMELKDLLERKRNKLD